jgi:SAM-dependent methyltransferase
MVNESSRAAALLARKREFGERARAYGMREEFLKGDTRDRVLEHLEPVTDEIALDLGSGPGAMSVSLAPFVRRVIALDLAPEMLRAGQLAARRVGRMPALPVAGDAARLPLRDASVQVVACRHAVRLFGDPAQVAGELARVMSLGGRVVIVDAMATGDPAIDGVLTALEALHAGGDVTLRTGDQWREILMAAGLRVDWLDHSLYELQAGRSLLEWFSASGASTDVFVRARQMLADAPRAVRDHLRVLLHGEDIQFHPPLGIIAARRVG